MLMISRLATTESTRAISTFCPSPVTVRAFNAARTPTPAESPARMSPIAVPVRVASPPGHPVVLMSPPIACAMMSYPGFWLYRPVWPNPEMHP